MIERYEVSEISKIWEDEEKFKAYLDIELALIDSYAPKLAPEDWPKRFDRKLKSTPDEFLKLKKRSSTTSSLFARVSQNSLLKMKQDSFTLESQARMSLIRPLNSDQKVTRSYSC